MGVRLLYHINVDNEAHACDLAWASLIRHIHCLGNLHVTDLRRREPSLNYN